MTAKQGLYRLHARFDQLAEFEEISGKKSLGRKFRERKNACRDPSALIVKREPSGRNVKG
jgi:hypothetical protein